MVNLLPKEIVRGYSMDRSLNLRQHIINQLIDSIEKGYFPSLMPCQFIISELFNCSHTMSRYLVRLRIYPPVTVFIAPESSRSNNLIEISGMGKSISSASWSVGMGW